MGTGRLPDAKIVRFRPSERDYLNTAEKRFAQAAREHGWAVSKRGWPDFLCFKDGELIAVEVKDAALGVGSLTVNMAISSLVGTTELSWFACRDAPPCG